MNINSRVAAYATHSTLFTLLTIAVALIVDGVYGLSAMAVALMTQHDVDKLKLRVEVETEGLEALKTKLKGLDIEDDDQAIEGGVLAGQIEEKVKGIELLDEEIKQAEIERARDKMKGIDLGTGGGDEPDDKLKGGAGPSIIDDLDKFKGMTPDEQQQVLDDMITTDKLKSLYFKRIADGLIKPSTALVQEEKFKAWHQRGTSNSGFDLADAGGHISVEFGDSAIFDKTKGLATTNAASDPTLHNLFFDTDAGEGITDLGILRKPQGPETFLNKIDTLNISDKTFRYALETDDPIVDNFARHERAKGQDKDADYAPSVKAQSDIQTVEIKRIMQELQCIATILNFDQCTLDEVNGFINWLDRNMRRRWTMRRKQIALNGVQADYGFDGLLPTIAAQENGNVAHEEGENAADMLDEGKCQIEADGFGVDCVILNPNDKKKLRESSSDCCEFTNYNPVTGQYVQTFHGMTPTYDKDVPEGVAIMGDFSQLFWVTNGALRFRTTDSNRDYFEKNILTGRWEQYLTLAIPCPQAFRSVELCPPA